MPDKKGHFIWKEEMSFFVPKLQYRQREYNAGENHAERMWYHLPLTGAA